MASANSPSISRPEPKPVPPRPIDPAMLALDDDGIIQGCSEACEQVFGYRQHELAGRHVSLLLPQLDDTELVQDDRINARLAYICRCAVPFLGRHRDGACFASELFINRLDRHNVVVLVRSLDGTPHSVVPAAAMRTR